MNIYISKLSYLVEDVNKYFSLYVKLIEKYSGRDKIYGYSENHHILPKSLCKNVSEIKDKNNLVKVTAREHFILHRILSKINFISQKHKRSMKFAVTCFQRKKEGRILNSRQYEICRLTIIELMTGRKVKDTTKNKLSKSRRNKCVFYDSEGNSFFLNTEDSRIKENGLSGNRKDQVTAKDKNENIYSVHCSDPRLRTGELVGIMKNKATYKDAEGNHYTLSIDDPSIKMENLIHINQGRTFKMPEGHSSGKRNGMYGRTKEVCCFDLEEKVFKRVPKNLFDSSANLVGVNNKIAKEYRKK